MLARDMTPRRGLGAGRQRHRPRRGTCNAGCGATTMRQSAARLKAKSRSTSPDRAGHYRVTTQGDTTASCSWAAIAQYRTALNQVGATSPNIFLRGRGIKAWDGEKARGAVGGALDVANTGSEFTKFEGYAPQAKTGALTGACIHVRSAISMKATGSRDTRRDRLSATLGSSPQVLIWGLRGYAFVPSARCRDRRMRWK